MFWCRDRMIPFDVEGRSPYCWPCGASGHMPKACHVKKAVPQPSQAAAEKKQMCLTRLLTVFGGRWQRWERSRPSPSLQQEDSQHQPQPQERPKSEKQPHPLPQTEKKFSKNNNNNGWIYKNNDWRNISRNINAQQQKDQQEQQLQEQQQEQKQQKIADSDMETEEIPAPRYSYLMRGDRKRKRYSWKKKSVLDEVVRRKWSKSSRKMFLRNQRIFRTQPKERSTVPSTSTSTPTQPSTSTPPRPFRKKKKEKSTFPMRRTFAKSTDGKQRGTFQNKRGPFWVYCSKSPLSTGSRLKIPSTSQVPESDCVC